MTMLQQRRSCHRRVLAAVLGACVVLAAAGGAASSASATRLCSAPGIGNVCPASNIWFSGAGMNATLPTASTASVITTSGGIINPRISCLGSTWTGTTTSAGGGSGTAVTYAMSGMTMTSCTSTGPTGCSGSATTTGFPTAGAINWTLGNNGSMSVTTGYLAFDCPVGPTMVTCMFRASSIFVPVTGGSQATMAITNATIVSVGNPACPTAARWTVNYVLTSPRALYITNS
jgi:hypothetical protein